MKGKHLASVFLILAEKVFVVISLLFCTDAILPLLDQVGAIHANLIYIFFLLVIQLVTILLIVAWHKRVVRLAIREKLLWLVVAITLASVLWSDVPMVTLGNSRHFLLMVSFGVYFAARYSLNEQLWLLAWMLGLSALLSIVFALALPTYGVMGTIGDSGQAISHAGAWRGIYEHKNALGRIMGMSAMIFLCLASSSRRDRWVAWAGFGLSVGLILLSTSKSSLIILLTIVLILPLYKALRWNYNLAVSFFIIFRTYALTD